MEEQELRAYFFQSMYLTGIHAGIQSQHTTAEMFTKYSNTHTPQKSMLFDWANKHKTTIVLNGGYCSNLLMVEKLLTGNPIDLPWASFRESDEALNNTLTNVGVIVPERLYNVDIESVEDMSDNYTPWDLEFIKVLKSCRLMN